MLVQEGHAGFIIGKAGARIKELRLVVIYIFMHCTVSVELHRYRPQTISATQKTKSATGKVHIGHRLISATNV